MSLLLSCESISKSYGSPLFYRLSFGIFKGDRIGLIGPNGSGKSTLLKILAGLETPDKGTVTVKRSLLVGYVPQMTQYPAASLEETLINAFPKDKTVDAQLKKIKAQALLTQLGFEDFQQSAQELSGGWKKRLDIAKALLLEPDLLLLDEPTNHLDVEGIIWLERFLQRERFSYIAVSHDRCFLENISRKVMEIDKKYPKGIFFVEGSYKEFIEKKEQFLDGQLQYQQSLSSKSRREQEWLRQNPKARTTKSSSRIQQAERLKQELDELKERHRPKQIKADFFNEDTLQARKLLTLKNISKTLGEKTLFSGVDLTFSPGTRLGIVGTNGTGKTTFLRLLAGEISPDKGTIKAAEGLKIAYFDQYRLSLPGQLSLRQALAAHNDMVQYRGQSIHIHSWLKRFLFSPEQIDLPIDTLSGGERARIALARFMLEPADLLLLDEPTNDLDIPTLETLEESLLEFPGAIALITHDRELLYKTCNLLLGLGSGSDQYLFADWFQWEAFRQQKEKDKKQSLPSGSLPVKEKEARVSLLKLSYREKKELESMEETILKIEDEIQTQEILIQELTIKGDGLALQEACRLLHAAQSQRDLLYARWEELEAKDKGLSVP